ncbi:MAG: ATP synthase F0 subunit B [Desulfobacteraceae bacterium]|nr:ATP synthase F0 subunit B [Desulfobacteraceae bacterium]
MMLSNRAKSNFSIVISTALFVLLIAVDAVMASGGEHGGGHGGGWAATDTYRVMNFAVLAIALFFLLRKPVAQFLGDRIQGIQVQLDDLESKKTEAEKKLAEYNERLSRLDVEAEKIINQYKEQGEALREKILKEAEAAASKLEEQAIRNIEHEFKQARLRLEQEVFEKAIAKAEAQMTKKITDQDQDKLIEEYLTKVVTN